MHLAIVTQELTVYASRTFFAPTPSVRVRLYDVISGLYVFMEGSGDDVRLDQLLHSSAKPAFARLLCHLESSEHREKSSS